MGGRYSIVRMGNRWVVLDTQDKGRIVFTSVDRAECNDWIAWAKAQV